MGHRGPLILILCVLLTAVGYYVISSHPLPAAATAGDPGETRRASCPGGPPRPTTAPSAPPPPRFPPPHHRERRVACDCPHSTSPRWRSRSCSPSPCSRL